MATLTYPRPTSLGPPTPAAPAGKRSPSIIARCLQAVGLKTAPASQAPAVIAVPVADEDLRKHLLQAVSDVERHINGSPSRDR